MNLAERLGAGIKAFSMVFASSGRWAYSAMLGRTRFDYAREVGNGRGNAALMAVIYWFCRAFPEAPLRVSTINRQGEPVEQPNHPLKLLLDTPNPFYSGELLWWATLADWQFGNAYWLKVPNATGRPVELWWIPAGMIEPKWPDDGSEFISHYEYTPNGQVVSLERDQVVHFRYGMDPQNMRKGLSPLGALMRELFTDDEAANYTASMLRNVGVPPVVVAPKQDASGNGPKFDQAGADEVKSRFTELTTGDNRGQTIIMRGATEITTLGFNPQQMDVKALRRVPEERISAVLGVPAVVVGLGAGLDRSTFANFSEAREAAYESNVIPCQRLIAAELRTQLLPDFGDVRNLKIDFDLSKVRVLQDDQNALHTRSLANLLGGGIVLNEFREAIGLEPLPGKAGDVLYVPGTVTPTDPEELLAAAEAALTVTELPPGEEPAEEGAPRQLPPGKMVPLRRRRVAASAANGQVK